MENSSSRRSITIGSSGSRTLTHDGDKKDQEEEQDEHDGYEFHGGITDLDYYSDWKEGNWCLLLPAKTTTLVKVISLKVIAGQPVAFNQKGKTKTYKNKTMEMLTMAMAMITIR